MAVLKLSVKRSHSAPPQLSQVIGASAAQPKRKTATGSVITVETSAENHSPGTQAFGESSSMGSTQHWSGSRHMSTCTQMGTDASVGLGPHGR